MEKRKLKTFINRREKKSPNISRRVRGMKIWEGEEAEGRKAAEQPRRAAGERREPWRRHGEKMPRNRGAGQSGQCRPFTRSTGLACPRVPSGRAMPEPALPQLGKNEALRQEC